MRDDETGAPSTMSGSTATASKPFDGADLRDALQRAGAARGRMRCRGSS